MMRFSVWFLLLLSGMCAVLSYPIDGDLLYEDGYFYNPSDVGYIPSYSIRGARTYINKRAHLAQKRASLDQLLQKLVEMYGNDDIQYSGRPSQIRFALGGRKR